ncbi:MAG TPA: glycoside hydrolase family 38 C-terminal domain-containing protein [Armatimonadota bacterium]|nr:glycoside hydrolase family 38 C-terminal domain-containing protein [Armatimonadota bacterium]
MPYQTHQKQRNIRTLTDRLAQAVYTPLENLHVTAWVTPEPVSFHEREQGKCVELTTGMKWGNLFDCAWFHFTGTVPASAADAQVVLLIDINGEACVVDAAGTPLLGLTTKNSDFDFTYGKPGKRVVPVSECATGDEIIDIWADAGCNDLFGNLKEEGTLKEACIAIKHPELYALRYDMEVLLELTQQIQADSARAHRIWAALYAAANEMNEFTDDEAARARALLAPELAKRGGDPSLTVSAIGHAHIDLAWLWPIRETIRKGARTFATALHMMERYPDYIFGASQPQLYKWMKQHYPALYEKVAQRIAEGRWEAQGAMWVEADTNISGGEALVRQLLFGKRFFRKEFHQDIHTLWLPDVFGYSGSLPQLLKKAGVEYFMTQKLSWSEINRYPHHTFHWEGIDGTTVLAHLPPEDTYNSSAAPRAVAKTERSFLDKTVSDRCLMLFGIGDGGGGPGEEHLERLSREKNLYGLAPVVQEPSDAFFQHIASDADNYYTWTGELYLEKHQGTFTTQGRNKRYNRLMELALRDAEFLSSYSAWLTGVPYPSAQFQEIWEEVLLYQFHDILPGSSITRVYDESCARYAALLDQTHQLTATAESGIFAAVDTSAYNQPAVVVNSLSWPRDEYVQLDGSWYRVQVPALGYTTIDAGAAESTSDALTASTQALENDMVRVSFNSDGSLAGVEDKENGRQALSPGESGNRLAVYRDTGDAWDFPMDYADREPEYFLLQSAVAHVDGPYAVLKQVYTLGNSTLTQEIRLAAGSRRIDFITEVDWHEVGKMLRTSFPVAVHANEATYDIQFGSLRRPTYQNTSWDMAKYEVCAHKWVDLSERNYGIALLNDCKYGHKVQQNVLDLNLLRSPQYPDPQADQGHHQFTYALYPHAGDHIDGRVPQAAYELNVPLHPVTVPAHPGTLPSTASYIQVDVANVIVEAVKKAEDSDDLILRLYEMSGAATQATVTFATPVSSVDIVNLLEEQPQALPVKENRVEVPFGPFEVQTLRVTRAHASAK